jgi:hypothetical protein
VTQIVQKRLYVISSGVAMLPLNDPPDNLHFVCGKMGLNVASMGGVEEDVDDDDDID